MEQVLEKKEEKSPAVRINEIKEKAASKNVNYKIVYDSFGESVEPIYFWLLDFIQDKAPNGLGMEEVMKDKDEYEAAVGSGFFSDLGSKATRMQEQAMKIMATINTVVRSIINLIYDLREFDIRLETYNDLKSIDEDVREAAEISLRVIWMDQVDIKRGRGSINSLAQQLQFVTLRDAFIYAKDESGVNDVDVNERVRRILKSRINEYLKWKSYSEKELRKRYNIEKAYLKSQYNSLRHYITWVKPYLIAAKKLNMSNFLTTSGMPNPNVVNVFNNLEIRLSLLGKREFKPEYINPELANLKLSKKYYSCVEAEIAFRTVPRATQSQQGLVYVHSGRTDINIKAYSFTEEQFDELKRLREKEDLELIDGMVEDSLLAIQEDIDKYLGKEPGIEEKLNYLKNLSKSIKDKNAVKEIEKEIKKLERGMTSKMALESPFKGMFDGFGQMFKALKGIKYIFQFKGKVDSDFYENLMKESAKSDAEIKAYILYDVYKKSHGMMAW